MNKSDVVRLILGDRLHAWPKLQGATAFAPTNIALCKYWGKRDQAINLPVTSSLSISLADKGAETTIALSATGSDIVMLNGHPVDTASAFYKRLLAYIDLFRPTGCYFDIKMVSTIPIAAGLASSACGFAALIMALNDLFAWNLNSEELSILARLGSGSASRSLWHGFVEWHQGVRDDGMDSHGKPITSIWPELCVGLIMVSGKTKSVSSREAMQRTLDTSVFYSVWPEKVTTDLQQIKTAINDKNFTLLGETAESNALAMHATMQTAYPPIYYSLPETLLAMRTIWECRQNGLAVYFTQDAGPNLKCLFMQKDRAEMLHCFPELDIVAPFSLIQ